MNGFWWLAFLQFIICGVFGLAALVVPKIHHIPSTDRPYFLGIAIVVLVLALNGLAFMSILD